MNILSILSKIGMVSVMMIYVSCSPKLNPTLVENVTIYGNCSMCKSKIEAAGGLSKFAKVSWNEKTKIATLTYDKSKTNRDQILKKIALAGYDSDAYLAPDDTYANLAPCCQYQRVNKVAIKEKSTDGLIVDINYELDSNSEISDKQDSIKSETLVVNQNQTASPKVDIIEPGIALPDPIAEPITEAPKTNSGTSIGKNITKSTTPNRSTSTAPDKAKNPSPKSSTSKSKTTTPAVKSISQLKPVFDNYFALKDALVKTDATSASAKARTLLAAIKAIKMSDLNTEEHTVWMNVNKKLLAETELIIGYKDVKKQRVSFITLSKHMYNLLKSSNYESDVYYQFCPMANDGKGANWLSKEKAVKNPYYGNEMLTCGKVVEVIK